MWSVLPTLTYTLRWCVLAYFSNRRKQVRRILIRSWEHKWKYLQYIIKKEIYTPSIWTTTRTASWGTAHFCWCPACTCCSWYSGSAHASLGGWWCTPRSGASRRCYRTPCLRGAPCVSAVCLWWQTQQCMSAWGRKTFFKYRLSCSTHFKVRYILRYYPTQVSKQTALVGF